MSIELFRKLPRISTMAGSYNVNDISMPCLYGLVVYAYATLWPLDIWTLNVSDAVHLKSLCVMHTYACARLEFVAIPQTLINMFYSKSFERNIYLFDYFIEDTHFMGTWTQSPTSISTPALSRPGSSSESECFFPVYCALFYHTLLHQEFLRVTHLPYPIHIKWMWMRTEHSERKRVIDRERRSNGKNNLQITIITVIIIRAKKE